MPLSISPYIDTIKYRQLIEFNDVSSPNVCGETIINFNKKVFNGGQPFKVISWNIILPTDPNPAINNKLQANVANNSEIKVSSIKLIIIYKQIAFSIHNLEQQ